MSKEYNQLSEERDLEKNNHDEIMLDITGKLKKMFEPDNIRDDVSQTLLNNLNGVANIARHLEVDLTKGISTENRTMYKKRINLLGKNDPVVLPGKSFFELIIGQFEDQTLRILIGAALLSLVIGLLKDLTTGWMDSVAIFAAILIIITITSVNDYLKEKQFSKLNATVLVLRGGDTVYESIYELTVGDILCLKIGDILPVDGILVSGEKLLMDESTITGESDFIIKTPASLNMPASPRQYSSFILSGSKVMDGYGNMLVCTVGINTQIGQMKEKLQEEDQPTPLQLKLENVANDIGKIGLIVAIMTVIALVIYLIVDSATGKMNILSLLALQKIVNFIMIGITIVVMAVPEGLPLAVTIALAFSVEKMMKENNLVKHMASCEIMGGANNICSDKTGTLTMNHMKVTHMYTDQKVFDLDQNDYLGIKKELLDILCENVCVNSEARPKITKSVCEITGNKTEGALLELCFKLGYHYENYRPSPNILKIIPFTSERKKMTTIYRDPMNGMYKVFCTGAAEVLLANCRSVLTRTNLTQLDIFEKNDIIKNVINHFGSMALRVIAIAYKEFNVNPVSFNEEELESNLILVAIIGIQDSLRPEIKDAIQNCKLAGINVRMVTGDNVITACAIAKECGILEKDYEINYTDQSRVLNDFKVLEGKKFRQLIGGVVQPDVDENSSPVTKKNRKLRAEVANLEIFTKIESQLKVLARSTPEDKFTLVTGLKQLGNVVAATGDGTNDAPALKKADVGFAMGIAGTDIAKEAAGIILLDDNFSSIVSAVKWGRNIYDSIRKFLQFQLTINIVALILAFLGACTIEASPINPIQMLWINLIMDTFASLALATEPPKDDLLKRKPHARNEPIITPNIVYQIIILCVILFSGYKILEIPNTFEDPNKKWNEKMGVHGTIFFNTFVMCQVFNQFNCRKLKKEEINIFADMCNNSLFWFIELITFIVQILLVEFGGNFVKCSPLNMNEHFICIILGFGGLIFGAFIKLIPECLFDKIKLLREDNIQSRNIDRSIPSLLRRKGSVRLRRVSSAF